MLSRSNKALPHLSALGKTRRWHQTPKNRILLENYYLSGDLEQKTGDFVAYCNHLRYRECIGCRTPADVNFGLGQIILLERQRIKRDTIKPGACNTPARLHRIGP